MDMISSGDNTPRECPHPTNDTGCNELVSMGRWVSIYNKVHGLIRRSIMPRYGKPGTVDRGQLLLEPLLHQITGVQDMSKLILLFAPSSRQTFHRKLHCFDKQDYNHLGSTCVTNEELELMQKFEMLFKYEMVFTDEYLPIKSLACDSAIIKKIVQSRRNAFLSDDEPPEPKIKSLRRPKIPVRLRESDVKRNKKIEGGDTVEPVWKL